MDPATWAAGLRIRQQFDCRLLASPSSAPDDSVHSQRTPSPPGTVRLPHPTGQHRRLPVTPQPPASYRHRLPQQPANCSITTSPLIESAHALNNSLFHWLIHGLSPPLGAPPKDSVREQGKHGFSTLLLSASYLSRIPAAKCGEQYRLPVSLISSPPCLGTLRHNRNA